MNPWRPTKIEWITYFALMPFIDVLLNYLLFGDRIWHDVYIWLYSFPIIYVQGFISWYLHIVAMHLYRVWFPLLKHAAYRLVLLFFTHVALTSLTFDICKLFNSISLSKISKVLVNDGSVGDMNFIKRSSPVLDIVN